MVDLFELDRSAGHYPKTATIHHLRAWEAGRS
jgi:hypothetical protein